MRGIDCEAVTALWSLSMNYNMSMVQKIRVQNHFSSNHEGKNKHKNRSPFQCFNFALVTVG